MKRTEKKTAFRRSQAHLENVASTGLVVIMLFAEVFFP